MTVGISESREAARDNSTCPAAPETKGCGDWRINLLGGDHTMRKILLLACAGVTATFLIAAFTTAASACPMHDLYRIRMIHSVSV